MRQRVAIACGKLGLYYSTPDVGGGEEWGLANIC